MSNPIALPALHRQNALPTLPAYYVWPGGLSSDTLQHVYFRVHLSLGEAPDTATLHLFADANYHLRVNGRFVGYGPCRFYPEYPEFDTYELTELLQPGENVIAVWVCNPGAPNFHRLYHPGGFIAWGQVVTRQETLDLATPGPWNARISPAFEPTAPKFSFAQGPIQIYDERLDVRDWDKAECDTSDWITPETLPDDAWGPLSPRSIPKLDFKIRHPATLLSAHPHGEDWSFHGFTTPNKPDPSSYYANRAPALAYTFIHSPRAQTVRAFTKWGENYLNGKFLERQKVKERLFSDGLDLELDAGWNFFFVKRALFESRWDFLLTFPREAGLRISALQEENPSPDSPAFFHAGPFEPDDEAVQTLDPATLDPESIPTFSRPWIAHREETFPTLPIIHQAWADLGPDLKLPASTTADFEIPSAGAYSYIFDMGGIVLGMPFVEFDAPAGTVIETGYSEDLKEGRPWLLKNIQVLASDRHIADGGPSRMDVFTPRGFRYLQLTVSGQDAPVRIRSLGIRTATYPHRRIGHFECSHEGFNQIYEMGWRTLIACSEDVYTDCPWRERTLYAGDMLPEFATAYVTSGDTDLIRRCIEIFVQSQSPQTGWQISMAPMSRERQTTLADYALTCLLAQVWHLRLTGDREFSRYTYPRFKLLMERALEFRHSNRLFALFNKPFIEHGPIGRDEDFNTALNALMVGAFEAMALLEEEFGSRETADQYRRVAHETAIAVESQFWNPEIDAFSDGLIDDELAPASHGVTNGYCSFFGATTPDREQAILQYYERLFAQVTRENPEALVSAYGAFFLLGGLYKQNHTELAERIIERCYGFMLEAKADTIWEHFDDGKSHCHAWSTAPNYYFATCTLGVKLGMPDTGTPLDRIVIRPQSSMLEWARGTVPHPLCPVGVSWRIEGDTLKIEIEKPNKEIAIDCEPVGRLAKFRTDLTIHTVS